MFEKMMNPFTIQPKGYLNIKDFYANSDMYFYPYARYAFWEALKKLEIKTIYIPSFICRDMLAPINNLKIKYYFYDIDQNLKPVLHNIKCDAILMVNYFGFPQDIEHFEKYKQKYNAIIIEDNAHGFLSRDKEGKLLGTRGDVGFLSIRKTIFLPNGGALLVNNDSLKEKEYKDAEVKNSYEDSIYYRKLNIKKKIFSKYIGIIVLLLRRISRYIKTGSAIPLPDKLSEKEMPSNSFLTPILKDKTILIDIDSEIKRRREVYIKIKEYAKKFDIAPTYNLDENSVPFEFAFIDNGKYKKFEKFLFTKGFFILPWPDLPDEIGQNSPKFYKNIKVVPFLW